MDDGACFGPNEAQQQKSITHLNRYRPSKAYKDKRERESERNMHLACRWECWKRRKKRRYFSQLEQLTASSRVPIFLSRGSEWCSNLWNYIGSYTRRASPRELHLAELVWGKAVPFRREYKLLGIASGESAIGLGSCFQEASGLATVRTGRCTRSLGLIQQHHQPSYKGQKSMFLYWGLVVVLNFAPQTEAHCETTFSGHVIVIMLVLLHWKEGEVTPHFL